METSQVKSLIDLYYRNAKHFGDKPAYLSMPPLFTEIVTWEKNWLLASSLAESLKKQGIQKGDRIGIFAHSSWRWEVCQLAIFISQAVVVGIDPNEPERNLKSIKDQTQLKLLFCEKPHLIEKWNLATKSSVPILNMNAMLHSISNTLLPDFLDFDPDCVERSDSAIIVFTSGTTSEPKGIEYSHGKVLFAIDHLVEHFVSRASGTRTVCWLPLANLFQRMMNYCAIHSQGSIYFVENPIEVMEHLPRVRPHIFVSVPRFYEKVFDRVQIKLNQLNPMVRNFIIFGIWFSNFLNDLTKDSTERNKTHKLLWVWDFLFFKKIRSIFGGEIDFLISGSAPLRQEIHYFFNGVGLPIKSIKESNPNGVEIFYNIEENIFVDDYFDLN